MSRKYRGTSSGAGSIGADVGTAWARSAGWATIGGRAAEASASTLDRRSGYLYGIDDPYTPRPPPPAPTPTPTGGPTPTPTPAPNPARRVVDEILASIDPEEMPPENVWREMSPPQREAWVRNFARARGLNQAETTELVATALTGTFATIQGYLRGEYQVRIAQINADLQRDLARYGSQQRAENGVINGMANSTGQGNTSLGNSSSSGSSMGGMGDIAIPVILFMLFKFMM